VDGGHGAASVATGMESQESDPVGSTANKLLALSAAGEVREEGAEAERGRGISLVGRG
jgi:hypothetical protein